MADFKMTTGQLNPPVSYLVAVTQGGLSVPYVLGDSVVTFSLSRLGQSGYVVDHAPATVANPAAVLPSDVDAGVVRYLWQAGDTDVADEFVAWFTLAGQDLPTFSILIADRPPSLTGKYTSPAKLKDFTGILALKEEGDEWLSENLIPRTESWIDSLGPFRPGAYCSGQVTLAANVLAEYVYLAVSPDRSQGGIGSVGDKKSETIGRYSYTLSDVSEFDPSRWNTVLDEILRILGDCIDLDNMGAEALGFSAGSTQVFPTLPGYERDSFEVSDETYIFKSFCHARRRRVPWGW